MNNTHNKILEATFELLWQGSYGAVSVDDICKAANIQKGSFYHHFTSKMDVVIASLEHHWQANRPLYDSIFSSSIPPLERLRGFCDTVYAMQKEKVERYGKVLGCPYMSCGSELCTQDEGVRQKTDEIFSRATRYFESLLRDAKAEGLTQVKNPKITAQEIQSYIAGVMYQAMIKNDVEILKRDLLPGLMRFFDRSNPIKKTDRLVNHDDHA